MFMKIIAGITPFCMQTIEEWFPYFQSETDSTALIRDTDNTTAGTLVEAIKKIRVIRSHSDASPDTLRISPPGSRTERGDQWPANIFSVKRSRNGTSLPGAGLQGTVFDPVAVHSFRSEMQG